MIIEEEDLRRRDDLRDFLALPDFLAFLRVVFLCAFLCAFRALVLRVFLAVFFLRFIFFSSK